MGRLDARKFTALIAAKSSDPDIRKAIESGDLRILCDPLQKKFWFAHCPDHLWDSVISEIRTLTSYSPLGDEGAFAEGSEQIAV